MNDSERVKIAHGKGYAEISIYPLRKFLFSHILGFAAFFIVLIILAPAAFKYMISPGSDPLKSVLFIVLLFIIAATGILFACSDVSKIGGKEIIAVDKYNLVIKNCIFKWSRTYKFRTMEIKKMMSSPFEGEDNFWHNEMEQRGIIRKTFSFIHDGKKYRFGNYIDRYDAMDIEAVLKKYLPRTAYGAD